MKRLSSRGIIISFDIIKLGVEGKGDYLSFKALYLSIDGMERVARQSQQAPGPFLTKRQCERSDLVKVDNSGLG